MKSLYYQFVNFIQDMSDMWYITIWMLLLACILISIIKFFKVYNGTQKKFEKLGLLFLAIVLIAILVYFTYLRK
ncbi:MAG: hypothetical protein E7351_04085 [Clostridiales bacterium]|nr:hypothetical protein [Clostridiales bacterium]